ncbi:unnamed protein product [Owenia fusiformis]|uniref:Uncharacterized protein n=1 Tax=Owenia fusiformis TaxID=6347 RepID=A0A8J1TFM8_OWEFU|nr:unnamed protein product [Owenia fusiformis]
MVASTNYVLCLFGMTCAISSVTSTLYKKIPGFSLHGYTIDVKNVKSLGKCGEICTANSACFSFNFELGSPTGMMSQCELKYCSLDANNSALVPDATMTYYERISGEPTSPAIPLCNTCVHAPCQNGGTCTVAGPFPSNFTCQCLQNFSGTACELQDGDCGGTPTYTGVSTIATSDGRIFEAYCDQGWTYVFNRFDGSENFNRSWVEFQQGFGDVNLEHFIGLDNLASILNQRSYKAKFDLVTWPSSNLNPATGFAEFSSFTMANASDKYRINIGGYSGTAGDSMSFQNGQQFTTYDQDNDSRDNENCAVTFKGAWWHASCHYSSLFGIYEQEPTCRAFALCVCWANYPGGNHHYSFKEAVMKLHRV